MACVWLPLPLMDYVYGTTPLGLLERQGDMLFRVAHYMGLGHEVSRFVETVLRRADDGQPCQRSAPHREKVRVLQAAFAVAAEAFRTGSHSTLAPLERPLRPSGPPPDGWFVKSPSAEFHHGLAEFQRMVVGLPAMHRVALLLSQVELLDDQAIAAVFGMTEQGASELIREAHRYACRNHTLETTLPAHVA